jgi:hypothetical protein
MYINGVCRTAANCAGWTLVTRYGSTKNASLSGHSGAGNLAGNWRGMLRKPLMRFANCQSSSPLPGTNKNNKLTFISILFLETYTRIVYGAGAG